MKRICACLILLLQLASCSTVSDINNEDIENTNATEISESSVVEDNDSHLPERDLEGYNFRVIKQEADKIQWSLNTFYVEEENGELINDAIYQRNLAAMQKYNFEISEINYEDDPITEVNKSIMAGDDVCDIALITLSNVSNTMTGNFMNVLDLPYVEVQKPYWDQNLLRDLTIQNCLYMLNGDILVTDNDSMMMTMYNRPLADDYGIENLYEAVNEGRWTYDLMYDCMKMVTADLDGDGVHDLDDRYGLLYVDNSAAEPYFASADIRLYKLEDGLPVYTADDERAYTLFEVINRILSDKSMAIDWGENAIDPVTIANMIQNKQVLFQNMVLSFVRRNYRDIENDFGLLPLPKLEETQMNYYTMVNLATPYIFVPITVSQPDKTGFILEALASVSNDITSTYYEACMASKYTRDEESYEMIELASENIIYDTGFIFNWGNLGTSIRISIKQSGGSYASLLASLESMSNTAMNNFINLLNSPQ